MLLSIIVPVYNAEKYLEATIHSLTSQTLTDLEIIAVNDGSKDHSLEILQCLASEDPRIQVIDQKNGGVSQARNHALAMAKGEYIAFLDSDDTVSAKMYETLIQKAKTKHFDVVCCDFDYVYEDGSVKRGTSGMIEAASKEELKPSLTTFYPVVWNRVFHRRIFDAGFRFKENVWYEDVEFLHRLHPYLNSVGIVSESFVQYYQRGTTITHTYDRRLFDYVSNWTSIMQWYEDHDLLQDYHDEIEFACVRYMYATFVSRAVYLQDKQQFKEAVDQAQHLVSHYFPNYKQNKYLKTAGLKGFYLKHFSPFTAQLLYLKH